MLRARTAKIGAGSSLLVPFDSLRKWGFKMDLPTDLPMPKTVQDSAGAECAGGGGHRRRGALGAGAHRHRQAGEARATHRPDGGQPGRGQHRDRSQDCGRRAKGARRAALRRAHDGQPRRRHARGTARSAAQPRRHRGVGRRADPLLARSGADRQDPGWHAGLHRQERLPGRRHHGRRPRQAAHRLRGTDRERSLQDDDHRSGQAQGRPRGAPPGHDQGLPVRHPGGGRGRTQGSAHRLRPRPGRERLRPDRQGAGRADRAVRAGRDGTARAGQATARAPADGCHGRPGCGRDRQGRHRLRHGPERRRPHHEQGLPRASSCRRSRASSPAA